MLPAVLLLCAALAAPAGAAVRVGIGELAWFVLAGLVIYALVAVYRYSRSY